MKQNQPEDKAEQLLLGLFDFERQKLARRQGKPFTTIRVQRAMEKLGNPCMDTKIVHIAGTKGKGSTALKISHGIESQGYNCGLFTSPHLISLKERIRTSSGFIGHNQMLESSQRLHQLNRDEFNGELSFFEFLFLMAMLHFKAEQVDFIVLETGLGGRLDATNVVQPSCTVLTQIDYDHCEVLGNTLSEIAAEKAGIIKKNTPTIALRQNPDVNLVFANHATAKSSPMIWVEGSGSPDQINDSLAKAALNELGLKIKSTTTPPPLPGRMHRLPEHNCLLDTAHNALSMEALRRSLAGEKRLRILFAMAESRAPEALLAPLAKLNPEICFCELPGGRPGLPPQQLQNCWSQLQEQSKADVLVSHQSSDLEKWVSTPHPGLSVITGSFYLVGAAYAALGYSSEELFFHKS
jgi:dihydrofolate synthase/folylpolyglutamate synthase